MWVGCLIGLLACGGLFLVVRAANILPDIAALAFVSIGFVALVVFSYLVSTPMTFASISQGGDVTFSWRYPMRLKRKTFPATSLAEPTLEERIDSDGDSHWSVQLVLPDGSVFPIAEHGSWTGGGKNEKNRQRCEAKRAQFMQDLLCH